MFSWADGGKRGGGLKELVQGPHKTRHKTAHKTLEVLRSNLAREPSPRWHKGPLRTFQTTPEPVQDSRKTLHKTLHKTLASPF